MKPQMNLRRGYGGQVNAPNSRGDLKASDGRGSDNGWLRVCEGRPGFAQTGTGVNEFTPAAVLREPSHPASGMTRCQLQGSLRVLCALRERSVGVPVTNHPINESSNYRARRAL